MADGQKRRVDYIADNQGFHILRDDADITNRIKREAEPSMEYSVAASHPAQQEQMTRNIQNIR